LQGRYGAENDQHAGDQVREDDFTAEQRAEQYSDRRVNLGAAAGAGRMPDLDQIQIGRNGEAGTADGQIGQRQPSTDRHAGGMRETA